MSKDKIFHSSNFESSGSRIAVADGDDLAMWFRSSDIEFWSTELVGEYTEFVSDLYSNEDDDPDKVSVSFANTIYDVIRIDIGGGGFNFEHDGNSISVRNTPIAIIGLYMKTIVLST